jgi:hypothetical protein
MFGTEPESDDHCHSNPVAGASQSGAIQQTNGFANSNNEQLADFAMTDANAILSDRASLPQSPLVMSDHPGMDSELPSSRSLELNPVAKRRQIRIIFSEDAANSAHQSETQSAEKVNSSSCGTYVDCHSLASQANTNEIARPRELGQSSQRCIRPKTHTKVNSRHIVEHSGTMTSINTKTAPTSRTRTGTRLQSQRYLPISAAAEELGLPKSTVSTWATHNMVRNLKAGINNSHRLIEMQDLQQLVAQKTEPSIGRTNGNGTNYSRCLIYVRFDEATVTHQTEDELQALLDDENEKMCQLLLKRQDVRPGLKRIKAGDFDQAGNFNREVFQRIMDMILAREIDILVVWEPDQLCPSSVFPLFEWICNRNHVAILCLLRDSMIVEATHELPGMVNG